MSELSVSSHKNIEINQSVFGSYLWVSFSEKSVCRFLFCHVLVCGVLLYFVQRESSWVRVRVRVRA